MITLTHGSLFAGIGGIDLGFEQVGIKTIWQVENDPYAIKVLEKHWPDVKRYDNITQVDFTKVDWVDVWSGGFPCQDISVAGKRKGINGKRSGLWSEFYRAICEIRPRYVVVENVPGLLISGLGRILGDLAEGGYDAEWDCIPAAAFGAPHLRYRVFIVAYSTGSGWSTRTCSSEFRGCSSDMADANGSGRQERFRVFWQGRRTELADKGQDVADTQGERLEGRTSIRNEIRKKRMRLFSAGQSKFGGAENWSTEPDVGRVDHGVPSRVDRLKCLGNAVVPQIAEWIGKLLVNHANN